MDILKKIQAKPENERKIIFWFLAIALGSGLLFGWLVLVRRRLANLNQGRLRQELKLPELGKQINSLPKPELNPEQLKQLEELLQKEEAAP